MAPIADLTYFSLPWRDLPGCLPVGVEIFAIGDVHGQAKLLDAALTAIGETPRSAAARHLVFLGDLIDRGPHSIAAVQMAMDGKARASADHLHILPGNHDLMLVDALNAEDTLEHWLLNGGKTVLAEVELSWPEASWPEIVSKVRQKIHPDYIDLIANGPTHLHLGDLIFVHAGLHPHRNRTAFLAQDRLCVRSDDHWASIRYPFLNWTGGWEMDDPDARRRNAKPTVVVHGHTPALRQNLTTAEDLSICDGIRVYRVVDLDIGAGHRPQLAWAHFRCINGQVEVRIHALTAQCKRPA
jgi:serine/threonine protein phosphatase 1